MNFHWKEISGNFCNAVFKLVIFNSICYFLAMNIDDLKKPKMIIFDYGHTLAYETGMDFKKGIEALMKFAVKNPNNFTAEDVYKKAEELFSVLRQELIKKNLEIKHEDFHRALFTSLNISFSLTGDEMMTAFWDGLAPAVPMPGINEIIKFCKTEGIRTAVISNLSFSENALRTRIKKIISEPSFEFVLVSSNYIFRKPHPAMFLAALNIAELTAEEVWYAGDNPAADVEGAANAGLQPVWFCPDLKCAYNNNTATNTEGSFSEPKAAHIKIKDWKELILMLKDIKK